MGVRCDCCGRTAGAAAGRRVSACVRIWRIARAYVDVANDELDDERPLSCTPLPLMQTSAVLHVAAHWALRRLLSLNGAGMPATLRLPVTWGGKTGPIALGERGRPASEFVGGK